MEIECMEAETRGLREDLWKAVETEAELRAGRPVRRTLLAGVRVSAIAALIVLASVLPLSVDQDRSFDAYSGDSIELLTSSESEILNALRQALSGGNSGTIVLSVGGSEESPVISGLASAEVRTARATAPSPAVVPEADLPPAAPAESEAALPREPSADEVISLIQVGQRALRRSERGISIYP
jgi:hypothetical protein